MLTRLLTRWLGVVVVVLLAVAAPATADHGETHVTLRTARTFFTCSEPVKLQNLALAQGRIAGWSTAAPTESVQQGAGCGYYENAAGAYLGPNPTTLDSVWEGTFAGNVSSVTVELHNIYAGAARATGPFIIRANLFVDGVEVYGPDAPDIRMVPSQSATRLSEKMTFTIAGLDLAMEAGDGFQVRTYRLVIRSVSEEQSAWVWGATEVPAGVTFNPAVRERVIATAR